MRNFMRILLLTFFFTSALCILLLLFSIVDRVILPQMGEPLLETIHTLTTMFAIAILCLSMFVIWHLADLITRHSFNLKKALADLEKLTKVIDTSFDGIVITDLRGIIRHVNPQWSQITGWSADEAIGKMTPAILKSGYHDDHFYADLWITIQNGKTFHREIINKRKDGGFYRADELILPLHNGRLTGYAAFHHILDADFKPATPPPYTHAYTEAS